MTYVVKDFKGNVGPEDLEKELNKLYDDGINIVSCEYIKHESIDFQKNPITNRYWRVIGKKAKAKEKVLQG
jgi:hypothetical protein